MLRRTLENKRENNVLDDDITVTADIEVRRRLQLYRIFARIEFNNIHGAIRTYFIQMPCVYPFRTAERTFRTGNEHETRLTNIGYGKAGNRHDWNRTFPPIDITMVIKRYANPVYDLYRVVM